MDRSRFQEKLPRPAGQKAGSKGGTSSGIDQPLPSDTDITQQWTDWYKVPRSALLEAGAARLLGMYSSWKEVLKAHYPEHPWDLSKFVGKAGSGYWQDNKNVADALDRAEKKLGITKVCIIVICYFTYLFLLFLFIYSQRIGTR